MSVNVQFQRLVSKIRLKIEDGDTQGYKVSSVRLRQAASKVRPFADGGSRAESEEEVIDGDRASGADLEALSAGAPIYFYTFENRQGTLLPGNTDPAKKVPEEIGERGSLCTYLEITCDHDGSALLEGRVTYRLMLGMDTMSNFDLVRNADYDLTLMTTYGGMRGLSWRVDVDCHVANAGVARVEQGLHLEDDLHVGEIVLLGIEPTPEFEAYQGALLDCGLVLVRDGEECEEARFGPIVPGTDYGTMSPYAAVMTCAAPSASGEPAEIYLTSGGRRLCRLPFEGSDGIRINMPMISFSTDDITYCPTINSEEKVNVDIYICDSWGQNLNSSSAFGFDGSVFGLWRTDIEMGYESQRRLAGQSVCTPRELTECFRFRQSETQPERDSWAARLELELVNDGSSYAPCYGFSALYGGDGAPPFTLTVSNPKAMPATAPLDFAIQPLKAIYADASLSPQYLYDACSYLLVSNPSRVELRYLEFTPGSASAQEENYLMTMWTSRPPHFHSRGAYFSGNLLKDCAKAITSYTEAGTTYEAYLLQPRRGLAGGGGSLELASVCGARLPLTARSTMASQLRPAIFAPAVPSQADLLYGKDNLISPFLPRELHDLLEDLSRVQLKFSYDETDGLCAHVLSNPTGARLRFTLRYDFCAECTWQSYSTQSPTSTFYHLTGEKTVQTTSDGTMLPLMTDAQIRDSLRFLNRNYWHNSSNAAVAGPGNRFSQHAIPKYVTFSVDVSPSGLPTLAVAPAAVELCLYPDVVLEDRSAPGCYYDKGTTNPDGSSRDVKSIKYPPGLSGFTRQNCRLVLNALYQDTYPQLTVSYPSAYTSSYASQQY